MRRATTSDVLRRSSFISNKQIVESPSSGNERISPSKFFANTVLPAPINVIFLDELLIGFRFVSLLPKSRKFDSLKQSVNFRIGLFECRSRIRSIQEDGVETDFRYPQYIRSVISNREKESPLWIRCFSKEGGHVHALFAHDLFCEFCVALDCRKDNSIVGNDFLPIFGT